MDTNFNDDQFDFDPSSYKPAEFTQKLPQPGEYTIKATSVAYRKNKDTGELVTSTGKDGVDGYRTLTLNRIEIVEPENGGKFGIFHDVRSTPFPRPGTKGVSNMLDLISSIDVNLLKDVESFVQAPDVAKQELESGATARVKLGYKATDTEQAKAELQGVDDPAEKRKVWSRNTYYTKAFRNPAGPGYVTEIKTPNGKTLEARLVIDSFVPSNKHGKSGPFYPVQG